MLWVCCEECPEFKNFFGSVLRGQRLKIAQYAHEVTPGRELIPYNDKKRWVLYWSFLDFGPLALSKEDAWFTGLVLRSNIVKNKIAGGMGQVFKVYNRMFFDLTDGCDFRKGVLLNVTPAAPAPAHGASAARTLVVAEVRMVIQDADAHQNVFDWKGAGSAKCCPVC